MAQVRFRSRRGMLNMRGEIAGKPIGVLRWSAIEHQLAGLSRGHDA